ncbi:MAG: stage 0 sporulation family protein [Chloroflexi bacterium]|nr:stage 0 sporulation family protein [Chloroflexota bacterium]
MGGVVGVRFKQACRVYHFDPAQLDLHVGDWVVVDSARGQALAQVVVPPGEVPEGETSEPLKPVVRKAGQEDIELASDLQQRQAEIVRKAEEVVAEMGLPMKVIAAECNLEANHVTIFFRAEERVDFRDLVKRLGNQFKMRVELRQAGPRDAAKMLGGMGRCGRTLCCATFLSELTPVSIKMAKDQNLPLNPTKISGVCGRLLCCLSYEVDSYRAAKAEARAACAGCPGGHGEAATAVAPSEAPEEAEKAPVAAVAAGKEPQAGGPPEALRKRRRPRRRKKKSPMLPGMFQPGGPSGPAAGPATPGEEEGAEEGD